MKTRHTWNSRSVFPKDHCKEPPLLLQNKLQTLSSFFQWHELPRCSWFPFLWTSNLFFCCLAVGRFSRAVFRAEQMAFEDQFHGESWSLLSLLWLMLLASCLTLLESTARGRQAWTSATHPRPHVTRRWEWHMVVQPESHTSAATSTTAVNHLAESPISKQALIPATLCDFNHFGETRGFSPWDVQSKQSNKKLGNAVLIVSQPLGGEKKKNEKRAG